MGLCRGCAEQLSWRCDVLSVWQYGIVLIANLIGRRPLWSLAARNINGPQSMYDNTSRLTDWLLGSEVSVGTSQNLLADVKMPVRLICSGITCVFYWKESLTVLLLGSPVSLNNPEWFQAESAKPVSSGLISYRTPPSQASVIFASLTDRKIVRKMISSKGLL